MKFNVEKIQMSEIILKLKGTLGKFFGPLVIPSKHVSQPPESYPKAVLNKKSTLPNV
jgi:hypothetical protein